MNGKEKSRMGCTPRTRKKLQKMEEENEKQERMFEIIGIRYFINVRVLEAAVSGQARRRTAYINAYECHAWIQVRTRTESIM